MKKTIYRLTLVTGLIAAGTLGAHAQDPAGGDKPRGPRPGGDHKPPAEVLKEFDKDGNGELDEEERKAARAAMEAKMAERRAAAIKEFDEDGDGELNEAERAKAMEARKAEMEARLLKEFDADGNGVLEGEEKEKADKAKARLMHRHREGGEGGPRPGGPRPGGPRPPKPE